MSAKSRAIGALLNTYLSSRPAKHALYDAGRVLRGGKRRARLYYRADDPYSHLLAQVAPRLKAAYGITVEIIPVAPPGLAANPAPEMLRDHAIRDAAILAERHGLSFPPDTTHPPDDRVRRAHAVLLEPRSADEQVSIAIERYSPRTNRPGRSTSAAGRQDHALRRGRPVIEVELEVFGVELEGRLIGRCGRRGLLCPG